MILLAFSVSDNRGQVKTLAQPARFGGLWLNAHAMWASSFYFRLIVLGAVTPLIDLTLHLSGLVTQVQPQCRAP
jgi:hypothetical protein